MEKLLWLRLGISLKANQEEVERIINGDSALLVELINKGKYTIEGETYIPAVTIEDYNQEHGTCFEEDEVCFYLGE